MGIKAPYTPAGPYEKPKPHIQNPQKPTTKKNAPNPPGTERPSSKTLKPMKLP